MLRYFRFYYFLVDFTLGHCFRCLNAAKYAMQASQLTALNAVRQRYGERQLKTSTNKVDPCHRLAPS